MKFIHDDDYFLIAMFVIFTAQLVKNKSICQSSILLSIGPRRRRNCKSSKLLSCHILFEKINVLVQIQLKLGKSEEQI